MSTINVTPEQLAQSARQFRKELLLMPIIGINNTIQHMRLRTGIRYQEIVGQMSGTVEIGPYDEDRRNKSDVKIKGRTLQTYLGSVWEQFSPNDVYETIYGDSIMSGDGLKNVPIAKAILGYMMREMSTSLNKSVWDAVRKDAGTKTKDLFDGFDTITSKEIANGEMSVAKRNLYKFTDVIDRNNALDVLKDFYRSAMPELKGDGDERHQLKMFIPQDIYDAYVDDYQQTVGAIVYNKEFDKTFLEGSRGQCELIPLSSKSGSKFIHMTPRTNMLVGVDQRSDLEKLVVERFHPFKLDLVATMFFGCQFESISPERLLVGELKTS